MDKRIAALMHHDSQVNGRMDRIEERIRKTAAQVGEPHGIAYAEGFKRITLS